MPKITKTLRIKLTDNYSIPNIDFDILKKASNVDAKDYRGLLNEKDTVYKIPLSGYLLSSDDTSSESYAPHSDWQGPSGDSWIGK